MTKTAIRTAARPIAQAAIVATLASIALPLAAQAEPQQSAQSSQGEASASMVTGVRSPLSAIAQPGTAGDTMALIAPQYSQQIVTLPDQPFDLSPGTAANDPASNSADSFSVEPSYRVPASQLVTAETSVSLDERYMPGLSGDLEEFKPRRTVTFRF